MISSPHFPSNPRRAVDARFQRAREIYQNAQRVTRQDGKKTLKVLQFVRELATVHCEEGLAKLRQKYPDLGQAVEFREEASRSQIEILEARLLGKEPYDSIAKKIALSSGVVKAYAEMFFDVSDRLEASDFIVNQVIGQPANSSSDEELEGWVMKTIAYFFGWPALDAMLVPTLGSGEDPASVISRQIQSRKIPMCLLRAETDDQTTLQNLLRLLHPAGTGAKAPNDTATNGPEEHKPSTAIEKHINAMLQEIPWVVGKAARDVLPKSLLELDDCPAELNSDELMLLQTGELSAEFLEEIKQLKFPSMDRET